MTGAVTELGAATCFGPNVSVGPDHWIAAAYRDGRIVGWIFGHPDRQRPGSRCAGMLDADTPENRDVRARYAWDGEPLYRAVEMEPLTLAPAIRCFCGDTGRIQGGRWTPTLAGISGGQP